MSRKRRRRKIKVEKLLELRKRAEIEAQKRYGTLFGTPEDAGQEYVARVLSGRNQHSTVSQTLVDMSRDVVGRKGQPKFEKAKAVAFAIPTDPELIRASHRPFDVVNRRLFLEKAMERLTSIQRKVILMYLDGLTFEEISDMLGFTEAWACQVWHEAVELLREVANE